MGFLQDEEEEETQPMGRGELEPPRNFSNPVYETMFQEREAPIIKPSVDVSSITSLAEQTSLLHPKDTGTSSAVDTEQEEHSGLLPPDQTPPPGRAVIHVDSD